jgi:uncharacterized membrane protein
MEKQMLPLVTAQDVTRIRPRRPVAAVCSFLLVLASLAPTLAGAASIKDLGWLGPDGANTWPFAVSADGKVVVGASHLFAFRWTEAGGMESIGQLPNYNQAEAKSVSANGAVITGHSFSWGNIQAFRWTATEGMTPLGFLPGDTRSRASAVSSDGAVIVGDSWSTGAVRGYRWTSAGMTDANASRLLGLNADGSVAVGRMGDAAHRWTQASGWTPLSLIAACGPIGSNTECTSEARATNADGSVVTGYVKVGMAFGKSFRWTPAGGMQLLGDVAGCSYCGSEGNAISADGNVIVGMSDGRAVRWTAEEGLRPIDDLLAAAGVNVSNWVLVEATGVSADGSIIVGRGRRHDATNNALATKGWIAYLPLPRKTLQVTPATVQRVRGNKGGPFAPPQLTYRINTTNGVVSYKVTIVFDPSTPRWLRGPTSGVATTTRAPLIFAVNANRLARGTYRAAITFSNLLNGRGTTTRTVVLTVLRS